MSIAEGAIVVLVAILTLSAGAPPSAAITGVAAGRTGPARHVPPRHSHSGGACGLA